MGKISKFFIAQEENGYRPAVLSYRAFFVYAILLLILRLFLGAPPAKSSAVEAETIMQLINSERTARNLVAATTHPSLLTAAAAKTKDMIDRDYFAHVDPDGSYVWPRITAAGYGSYKILGENLALDFATSEGMIKAWLDSPTHRENLLHTDFRDQGVAAAYGDYQGRYSNLTTSLFGTRAVSIAPAPAPPKPQTKPAQIKIENPASTPTSTTPAETKTADPLPPFPIRFDLSAEKAAMAASSLSSIYSASRIVFTLFGIALLLILLTDSIIILRHELALARSHSSYHLFSLFALVLISILIWWW